MTGVRPVKGCGRGGRGGSAGDQLAGDQCLFTKLLAPPTPIPGTWTYLGTGWWAHFLASFTLSLAWAGLYHGLLPSLLASNLLAPPCPTI